MRKGEDSENDASVEITTARVHYTQTATRDSMTENREEEESIQHQIHKNSPTAPTRLSFTYTPSHQASVLI